MCIGVLYITMLEALEQGGDKMMAGTVMAVMLAVTALLIVFDITLALDDKKGNTISEILRELGRKWPIARILLSFGFGLLTGHFFW